MERLIAEAREVAQRGLELLERLPEELSGPQALQNVEARLTFLALLASLPAFVTEVSLPLRIAACRKLVEKLEAIIEEAL